MRPSVLATALLLLPVVIRAEAPAPAAESVAHRHVGFHLRLDAGVGFLGTSAYVDGIAASVSGVSIPVGATVGAAVVENLIVAGEAFYTLAPSPVFVYGDRHETASESGVSLLGIGPNVTWYYMPENVFFSLTPALVFRPLRAYGTYEGSKVGFGLKAAIGKEWWVDERWALGVAGQFYLGLNQGNGDLEKLWATLGGGIALTASYQ